MIEDEDEIDDVIEVSEPDYTEKHIRLDLKCGRKNTSVECKLCHSSLAYHGGTSTTKEHLKRKHPVGSPFSAKDGYKQRKLDIFAREKKQLCSSERAGAISKRIAVMIVRDLCPINIVNGKGFQQFWSQSIGFLQPPT